MLTSGGTHTQLLIRKRAPNTLVPRLRLLDDLRDHLVIAPFGTSERCSATRSGSDILVTCAEGTDVAGFSLRFGGVPPPGAKLKAHVAARSSQDFRLQIVNDGDDASSAVPVADRLQLALPPHNGAPPALVILAPQSAGELRLTDFRLLPTEELRPLQPSAWAWEGNAWRNDGPTLVESAVRRGLMRLYISIDIVDSKIKHAEELASFVRQARRAGIAVEVVEGDPRMVLRDGLSHGLRRARAIADYQRRAPKDARFDGIQYDVEPYTLSEWGTPSADHAAWSGALAALSKAAESRIDVVLPFWIANDEEGTSFLKAIVPVTSGITVMSYRDDGALAAFLAQPLLDWGVAAGKPVRIALEAGPVASESEELFVLADEGRLAILEVDGRIAATVFPKPTVVPGALMYASLGVHVARPERVSFFGDEQRMIRAAHDVAQVASAWSSFEGIGYHGLSWPAR